MEQMLALNEYFNTCDPFLSLRPVPPSKSCPKQTKTIAMFKKLYIYSTK